MSAIDESRRLFSPGARIFQEGEAGDCAYIVESGRVEIVTEQAGERMVLATRGPGEIFGEMALIDSKPRTATAEAIEPVVLLVVSRAQINNHLDRADPILRMLITVILERSRDTIRQLKGATGASLPPDLADRRPGHDDAINKIRLEREIKDAITRGEFELFFQPVVALDRRAISGFEALIRWRHPEKGMIPPDRFIPTAEDSGLIVEIGRWVMVEACAALSVLEAGRTAGGKPLFMTVNVSGREFIEPDFLDAVDSVLAASPVDPAHVTLEITESMLISDPDLAAARLSACAARGLAIALDDFGTGYSSLSYLTRFPIHKLKVDQSFIRKMNDDPGVAQIVRAIVTLAKGLGMAVIAEGVETVAQMRPLVALGVDYGQGWLFGKPMPLENARALLAAPPPGWADMS